MAIIITNCDMERQPSPSRSEASARKKRGCSTRLGPRCDVTAKGASEPSRFQYF